ncbi:hypothetical protein BHE74_00053471 [Ensete ventricosum]|nr:hypothetical protein BHE74_00053471 [Ensete ventricosum]
MSVGLTTHLKLRKVTSPAWTTAAQLSRGKYTAVESKSIYKASMGMIGRSWCEPIPLYPHPSDIETLCWKISPRRRLTFFLRSPDAFVIYRVRITLARSYSVFFLCLTFFLDAADGLVDEIDDVQDPSWRDQRCLPTTRSEP